MILGVPFLDRYVRAILSRERKVYLEDPRTKSSSEVYLKSESQTKKGTNETDVVKVTAAACIPPLTDVSESPIGEGRSVYDPPRAAPKKPGVRSERLSRDTCGSPVGRMDGWNFLDNPAMVTRGQVVGVAEVPPESCMMVSRTDQDTEPAVDADLEGLSLEVNEDERPKVLEMLKKHAKFWDGHLGHIRNVQHHIPTTGPPKRQAPYRCGLKTRDAVAE
jgi:hypothetical protein